MTKSQTKSLPKLVLSSSRDIPFYQLVLSQKNVRRVKAGLSIEDLADDIYRRTLLQSLNVRAVVGVDGQETGQFEVPAGGRRFRALELLVKSKRMTDDDMLALLSEVLKKNGYLSGLIIDEFEDGPSSSAYQSRFGSLLRAYSLIGFSPDHDYRYIEINRELRRMHPSIVRDVIEGVRAAGGTAIQNLEDDTLTINDEITASIVIARCKLTRGGLRRWKIRLDETLRPDLTICARMDEDNMTAHDFYILPRMTLDEGVLRLADHNGLSFDAFRFDALDGLFTLAKRVPFRQAA